MEETVVLNYMTEEGIHYQATFLPSHGMNLISYKREDVEVIDQSTKTGFEERSSGLGPLIGPHFHRRKILPEINYSVFPQYFYCKEHGIDDIFSHGVARYVPWNFEKQSNGIKAKLSGKDLWQQIPLATIEGQNFQMGMDVTLDSHGLKIDLSIVSDSDSLVGIHYYYRLPNGKGIVRTEKLILPLDHEIDQTYRPSLPREGHITLV